MKARTVVFVVALGTVAALSACSAQDTATSTKASPPPSPASSSPQATGTLNPMTMDAFPKYDVVEPSADAGEAWKACVAALRKKVPGAKHFDTPSDSAYVGAAGDWRIGINFQSPSGTDQAWDCHATLESAGQYAIVLR